MKPRIKPQPCTEEVTHWHPHPDEGFIYWAARRFAKHIFRGLDESTLVFVNAGQRPPDNVPVAQYEKTRLVYGTCGGRYDEHALNKDVRKRYAASSLFVRDLGLEDDPHLKSILDYTLANDREGTHSVWDLGSVMFSVNVLLKSPLDGRVTLELAAAWYDVAYDFNAREATIGPKPKRSGSFLGLNDFIRLWLINRYAKAENREAAVNARTVRDVAAALGVAERRHLDKILELSDRVHDESVPVFDIHRFVEMALAVGREEEWISEQVSLMLNAIANEQKLFWKAYDELPAAVGFVQLWRKASEPTKLMRAEVTTDTYETVAARWREKGYGLAYLIGFVKTNNPVTHKAFRKRYKKADVVILRKPNGHTVIKHNRLEPRPFALRLRGREAALAPLKYRLTQDELLRDGNLYAADGTQREWCNFEEGNAQLNGSFTALDTRQMPPTRMKINEIVATVVNALEFINGLQLKRKARRKGAPQQEQKPQPPKQETFSNTPRIS